MRARRLAAACLLAICAGPAAGAAGPCVLANPSFEISGAGGAAFGGWNQFGVVGGTGEAVHGTRAARIAGPDAGGWDVSGCWQSLAGGPGESWRVTGHVRHPAGNPLTAQCAALVNVEWRDAAEALIAYDSFTVADAAAAAGGFLAFDVTSAPAPAGTASVRLLLGVLQSPGAPAPEVHFDGIAFVRTTPPTADDVQWNDFPGERRIVFAGRYWRVKGPGLYGPGPNLFCDDPQCVRVDADGRLHLTLQDLDGSWRSTEVVAEEALGYGDYVVTTQGALEALDPMCVLGFFLWEYGLCWDDAELWWNPYNEIDVEYGRWGDPAADVAQFVAQPYDWPGNLHRFAAAFGADGVASHAMRWLPDRVEFRVWRGGPADETAGSTVAAWTYAGPHVPRPGQPRLHLNLWKLPSGSPAAGQEAVVSDFTFVPAGGASAVDAGGASPPPAPAGRLLPASPNPFNARTSLGFTLQRAGRVALDVHDLGGRRVCSLLSETRGPGRHAVTWDGLDDAGRTVGSGVYLVQLRGAGFVETRAVTLVK